MRGGWEPWQPGHGARLPGLAQVIGHRGVMARAPENTLAGLRQAKDSGVTWVELDVMLTGDGTPILMHDETLDRTTDGSGPVAERTAMQVAGLDAGAWFAPQFRGEPVPTLAEAVRHLVGLGLNTILELKTIAGREQETGSTVAAAVAAAWPAGGPHLLLSSFARPALEAARAAAPDVPRGLLAELLPADWQGALTALECTSLHLAEAELDRQDLEALRAQDVPVLCYTVNDEGRARELLAGGVRAVITDDPGRLRAVIAV